MNKNLFYLVSIFVMVTLTLSACQPEAAPTSEAVAPIPVANLTQEQILTIGVVSDDPAGTIEGYQPFMDYIAKQLGDLGIVQGNVVVTADFDTMDEKLKSGEVDLFYETPYGALYAYEHAGVIPLLRGWRKGIGVYHSTIFVRKDSGITSIDNLRGKLLAFAEPDSTSGYYLPKAYLVSAGLNLSEKSTASAIPAGEVGYMFTGSDENVLSAILLGNAIGGGLEYDVYDELTQEQKDQFTILAQTPDVPRSLMMVSSTMSPALRERLIIVLKNITQTEEGKAVMAGPKKTTQFDDLPLGPQATMVFLQEIFAPAK